MLVFLELSEMHWNCPKCQDRKLEAHPTKVLQLDGDAWSDEISLQLAVCQSCCQQFVLVYQESRRGSLDSDCFSHEGYWLDSQTAAELERWVTLCPDRHSSLCRCCAHVHFSRVDSAGRWLGLAGFSVGPHFIVH